MRNKYTAEILLRCEKLVETNVGCFPVAQLAKKCLPATSVPAAHAVLKSVNYLNKGLPCLIPIVNYCIVCIIVSTVVLTKTFRGVIFFYFKCPNTCAWNDIKKLHHLFNTSITIYGIKVIQICCCSRLTTTCSVKHAHGWHRVLSIHYLCWPFWRNKGSCTGAISDAQSLSQYKTMTV